MGEEVGWELLPKFAELVTRSQVGLLSQTLVCLAVESARQRQFLIPLLLLSLQSAFDNRPSNVLPVDECLELLLVRIAFPKLVHVFLASVVYHPKFRGRPTNAIFLAAVETEVGFGLEQAWQE